MQEDERSPFLTTAEAARYLRYRSRSGVLMAMRRGELKPAGKRGRALLFRRSDLDAMVGLRARACAPQLEQSHEQEVRNERQETAARSLAIRQEHMDRTGPVEMSTHATKDQSSQGGKERDPYGSAGGSGRASEQARSVRTGARATANHEPANTRRFRGLVADDEEAAQ